MSDLQRLRAVCCPDCVDGDSCGDCQAIHDAAGEIERLRAEHTARHRGAEEEIAAAHHERDEGRAEIARLSDYVRMHHRQAVENLVRAEQAERERDEARKEATWLLDLLSACATLLDQEGIPTPARQVMLARIQAAKDGLGERDE